MAWITPIASGPNALGDLSGQYWNVAQRNLATQEGDIARQNAAQQGWNRWNSNVADLQAQQEAEQYRRDQAAQAAQRHQFEWGVGRQDRAAELAADNALRLGVATQRSAADEQKNFTTLQSHILNGQVRNIDEAWAYIPKTPDNVIRVSKLLETANNEATKKTLEAYDAETAKVQADQLAHIIKAKGAAISDKDKEAAMWLDPTTLNLIPRKVGAVVPGARWDYEKKKWTIEPEPGRLSNLGELRRMDDNLDLSRWAPAPPPAMIPPVTSNQGGGWTPIAPPPTVSATNPAPVVQATPGWTAPTVNLTPPATNDLVSVFNPDGRPVKIRRSQLTDAIAKGYRLR